MPIAYVISTLLTVLAETQSPGRGGNTEEGSGIVIVLVIAAIVLAGLVFLYFRRSRV